ncbi:MAG: 4'-phosphopantetheinyl transferase superfamily protein [bacterium]
MAHWNPPPLHPDLAEGEAHLWRIDQSPGALLEERRALLSADEIARSERYRFARHREHFVMRRGALRSILAAYVRADPRELTFRVSAHGKPELAGVAESRLRFNVSHSEALALVAVTRGPDLGVDVELVRPLPEMDRLAREVFSPAEYGEYCNVAAPERPLAFFHGWTRKEAWLKGRGEGLLGDLASFDVTLTPGRPAHLVRVAAAPDEPRHWCLRDFTPLPGYAGALAVRAESCEVACWAP